MLWDDLEVLKGSGTRAGVKGVGIKRLFGALCDRHYMIALTT